jgi:colanic acid biosynthesis protein WcaH
MEVHDEYVPEETFREFVAEMPQVCVEVVVEREDGAVLLARRTNEPVAGEWFWPGSRLYKGERLADAAERVGREELGTTLAVGDRLGVYEHRWETSREGPSRHTVNVVFRARFDDGGGDHGDGSEGTAAVTLDDQHDAARFVHPRDVDDSYHEYVRRYAADLRTARAD